MALCAVLLLLERIPAMDTFIFESKVPEFYKNLSYDNVDKKIFLYPNFNYFTLLREDYYQTVHGKKLSFGVLSRFPSDERYAYYKNFENLSQIETLITDVKNSDFDYIVAQKLTCTSNEECFHGSVTPIPEEKLVAAQTLLEKHFGKEVYEDESIMVYENQNH